MLAVKLIKNSSFLPQHLIKGRLHKIIQSLNHHSQARPYPNKMETELNVREEFPALLADPEVIFADAATGTQVYGCSVICIQVLSSTSK